MIKRIAVAVLVFAAGVLGADLSGPWQGTLSGGRGTVGTYVVLQTKAGQLSGTIGPDKNNQQQPIENARTSGNKVSFRSTMHTPDRTITFDYDLTLDGDAMHGTFTISNGKEQQRGTAEFKRAQ
jgi:poly(3-hydroxyalkanoate) synthetase